MRWLPLLLFGVACAPDGSDEDTTPDGVDDTDVVDTEVDTDVPPGCGDGILDDDEACDDGEANSDTTPDACRTDCTLPTCGDGVTDTGEACDDGNILGGDGCSPLCTVESGQLEGEPNDTVATATPITPGVTIFGGLTDLDLDCFAVEVPDNGFVDARATGPEGTCPPDLSLQLFDPDGELQTSAFGELVGDCAHIDPVTDNDALYLEAGTWTVCVEGLFRTPVASYRLTIESGDDSCLGLGTVPDPDDDLDLDGLADPCDSDDDDDGVPDTTDNCPRIPNGPTGAGYDTSGDGFIRQWLLLGPITGNTTTSDCLPSGDQLLPTDADAAPALGMADAGLSWTALIGLDPRPDFTDIFSSSTPREVYAFAWVYSAVLQDVQLRMGTDDGHRAWVNGVLLGETGDCQGVTTDDYRYDTALVAGWNRVLIKVRDNGGGWGLTARFTDPLGDPLTDLDVSLTDGPWIDDQSDGDGDGIGDVCDETP